MTVLTLTLNPAIDKTISLPNFEVGGLNRLVDMPREDAGGKGINVAKVLNQLQIPVTTTGWIAGQTGKKLSQDLSNLGIETEFVAVEGAVRTNIKIVDQQKNETTEINEPGFQVNQNNESQLIENLERLLPEMDYLVLGGSIPRGTEDTIYQTIIDLAKKHDVKPILDASGKALKEGLKAKPFAIKPNIHELEQLLDQTFNHQEDIAKACQHIIEVYDVELVVTSLGKDGAIYVTKEECYHTHPFEIEAKSTVGAGDSMVGAMIYSLLNQFNLEKLAKWATAAGTITASKPGTCVCRLEEIEQSYEKVLLKSLSLGEE